MTRHGLWLWTHRGVPIAAVVATLSAGAIGCAPAEQERGDREEPPAEAGEETSAGAEPAGGSASPGEWVQGFALGSRVDTRGAVPPEARADEFRIGQPFYVSMAVGDAAPAASVHAVFYDGSGRKKAEDAKKVPARAGHLYFDSGDTSDWTPGEGTVAISVDGRPVQEESFTLAGTASAGTSGASTTPSGAR